ncbi:MAG: hypothetical protein JW797_04045 [Bradymonadales bacterium]|nr:hypothetical protein [Bradymonadales bacterium]
MVHQEPERTDLPQRKVLYATYEGPNSGLGKAVHPVYAWVGTYYQDRVSDVTVAYSHRPSPEEAGNKERQIQVEIRFDLDEYIPIETKVPPGLAIKQVASETIISRSFAGPLPEMQPRVFSWLEEMSERYPVASGYRQRFVTMAQRPDAPDWEIEVQLVLKG